MSEIKWIKITTAMFDDEKIKVIQSMPEGDAILITWIRLLTLAGKVNDNGYVYFNEQMPYTVEMLATIFNKPLTTIRLALQTFESFGMIESTFKGIAILNWEKHQNIDGMDKIREQTKSRVANHRKKQKAALLECNVTSNATVTRGNATEEELDKELELNTNTGGSPAPLNDYVQEIFDLWQGSAPHKHKALTLNIEKAIRKLKTAQDREDFKEGLRNYVEIYESEHFYEWKWTLDKFITQSNGYKDFLEDGQRWVAYLGDKSINRAVNGGLNKYTHEYQLRQEIANMKIIEEEEGWR